MAPSRLRLGRVSPSSPELVALRFPASLAVLLSLNHSSAPLVHRLPAAASAADSCGENSYAATVSSAVVCRSGVKV